VKLTVVGCSGSYPGPDSPCSCYLLEADGVRILVDLGNGALGALQRHTTLASVDAVLLSHLHADHCLDLACYFVARKYDPTGQLPKLAVYGPRDTHERIAGAYDVEGATDNGRMGDVFDFRTVVTGTFDVGPFRITADRMPHPVESYAYRIEAGGRSLVYSGDTGVSDDLVRIARGADLLLCEASFEHGREDLPHVHLNGRQAGEHAERAGVDRLLLTHIPPWTSRERNLDDARKRFSGAVDLALPDQSHAV
jgi:ribonuclease BN (tRNA processing enzyme)